MKELGLSHKYGQAEQREGGRGRGRLHAGSRVHESVILLGQVCRCWLMLGADASEGSAAGFQHLDMSGYYKGRK